MSSSLLTFLRALALAGCVSFIVHKTTPGFRVTKMENKVGLRIVQNGDITLTDAFVPDEDRLPGVESFKDTNKATTRTHTSTLRVIYFSITPD